MPTPSADWIADCQRYWGRVLSGAKAHWCPDWDYLPIDETTKVEIDACTCRFVDRTVVPGTIYVFDAMGRAHRRYGVYADIRRVGHALMEACLTARPDFRDMADNMRWEDIR